MLLGDRAWYLPHLRRRSISTREAIVEPELRRRLERDEVPSLGNLH